MRLESMKRLRRCGFLAALLAAVLAAPGAPACGVPVFRYALERWRAELYELVVFRREPLGPGEREAIRLVEGEAPPRANCQAVEVDLAAPLEDRFKDLWEAQSSPALPLAVLRPRSPNAAGVTIWSGPLTVASIRTLLDSPARREIAKRLTGSHSGVWVLLESGDRAADVAAAGQVEVRLQKLEKELKLPDPEPRPPAQGGADAGTPPGTEPALRIRFSLLRIARGDPAESAFIAFLLKMRGTRDPADPVRPVVFPVFGRGRVLCAIEGKEIEEDLRDAAVFLTGPCSCELKEMNPGADLLITADWDGALQGEHLSLPDLVGVSGILEKAGVGEAAAAPPGPPASGPQPGSLSRSLLVVAAGAAVFLGLATAVFLGLSRSRGRRNGA